MTVGGAFALLAGGPRLRTVPFPAPDKEQPLFLVIALFITVTALVVASMQPYNLLGDPWRLRLQRRFRR